MNSIEQARTAHTTRGRNRPSMLLLLGALALALAMGSFRPAESRDWPQWRGPGRDGVARDTQPPRTWPRKLEKIWEVKVGEGYSGPVTAGDRIVLLLRRGEREFVVCLANKDGRQLWQDSYEAKYNPEYYAKPHGKGPFATPTIHNGRVFTVGIRNAVSCFDLASGKRIWQRTFADEFKQAYPMWGASNSPLIESNLCILGIGTEDDGALAALDKDTGKTVWKLSTFDPAYAPAVGADLAGYRQIIMLSRKNLLGLSPADGAVLWQTPYVVSHDQNAITPTVHEDLVICSGWKKETIGLRITKRGERIAALPAWSNSKMTFFMSSPVVFDGHLFGLAQRRKGSLVCLDLKDGLVKWSSPGRVGEYASITRIKDQLLVLTTRGELIVVAADPAAHRELYRSQLTDRPVWAHLAVTGDRLYVKDETHLVTFALPAN